MMTPNKPTLFLLLGSLFFFLTLQGQETSSWYSFSLQGGKQKITEMKDFILYEEVKEKESPYPARIDTVGIEKRLNDSILVVTNRRKNGKFALMATTTIKKGAIQSIGVYYPSETVKAVEDKYRNEGLPVWSELTTRWVFSEKKSSELEKAPGYDEVSREAILEALSVRKDINASLKAYLKAHPDTQQFRLYRFVEMKGQQKFILLGYNPYKQVIYNFEKQFEGDEEVTKALTEPISFD